VDGLPVTFWEHEHGYQPRRLIDGFTGEERVHKKGLVKRVRNRRVKAKNWFDVVLIPGSVYDEIVKSSEKRSLNIEPLTLVALKRLNRKAYDQLMDYVLSRKTFIAASSYCHPILPMRLENSEFDARINFYWSLLFYYETFWRRIYEKEKRVPLVGFWLPECAYSKAVLAVFLEVLEKLAESWGWADELKAYLLLDEIQGKKIDPSRVYVLKAGNRQCFAFLRYNHLSNTIAFEPKLKKIMTTFWKESKRCKQDLIGVANDAEHYGGNYDPDKPADEEKMRMLLEKRGWIKRPKKRKSRLQIAPAALYLENFKASAPETELVDYTSWSDFEEGSRFQPGVHPKGYFEYLVGRSVGGLCRWKGLQRNSDGTWSNTTYFLIVPWKNPSDGKTYVKIVSSMWKVAFNKIRDETAEFVRLKAFKIIRRYLKKKGALETVLSRYWVCALQQETVENFIEQMTQEGLFKSANSKIDREALKMALQAYQWACQDAYLSCPTFWHMLDNQLTWTSLSHAAAALAKIASAFHVLKQKDEFGETAEKYKTLFLDFATNSYWRNFVENLEAPLTMFLEQITESAKINGYDLSETLSSTELAKKSEKALRSWALKISRKLYETALENLGTLMPEEENPHLVLALAYKSVGREGKAEEETDKARWREWRRCIQSVHSDKNAVQRIGFLHAKHFPEYKRLFGISEKDTVVDVKTTANIHME